MKDWFFSLSDREQSMAKSGALFLSIALLLAFVYLPVNRSLESKYLRLTSLNQQLDQMKQTLNSSIGAAVRGSVPQNTTFSAWIDQFEPEVNHELKINKQDNQKNRPNEAA